MRATPESIRKLFIHRFGEAAFESIAKRYAEVAGDSSLVDLSSVTVWREFATAIKFVPSSDVLKRAFLWCTRHREPLENISRAAVPPDLDKLEDLEMLREIFDLYPHFIANSETGFRCSACFDSAAKFVEDLAKNPTLGNLRKLVSIAEQAKGSLDSSDSDSKTAQA